MLEKLQAIYERYLEVGATISSPQSMNDMKLYVQLNKEYKDLGPIVKIYHEYKNVVSNIDSSKQLLKEEKDEEMREMAKMELDELLPRKEEMDEEIKILLIPKDPEDSKNKLWKLELVLEEMRQVFLQEIYIKCIWLSNFYKRLEY